MQKLFEYIDVMNVPFEAFLFTKDTDNFPIHPHWHYYIEVLYMVEGKTLVECDENSYLLEEGDLILFHPKSIHAIYPRDDKVIRYAVIKFDINSLNTSSIYVPSFRYVLKQAQMEEGISSLFTKEMLRNLPIKELFLRCIEEMEHMYYGYDIAMRSNLCVLMTYLLRIWRSQGFNTMKVKEEVRGELDLDRIIEYIDAHSGQQLLVSDLAKQCNMSYSYFAKSFKQLYGKSCKQYIDYVRISKAQDMLLFTAYDLNYISQETGFSDCSHFIKTYKRIKGVTPKKFKTYHETI